MYTRSRCFGAHLGQFRDAAGRDRERAIEATLLDLNKRFRVRKVWYDPFQMHATAQRLIRAGLKLEEFPQTVPNLTDASQNLLSP